MLIRKSAAVLFLLPALMLGACGQSTPVAPPVAVAPVKASTLSLHLFIPNKGLKAQFVSGATTSLRVQFGDSDTTLAIGNANCVADEFGRNCTFRLNVAPGANQTLIVGAYDESSNLLGSAAMTVSIIAGQDNPLSLTLTGIAASATLFPTSRGTDITAVPDGSLLLDLGGEYGVGVLLRDAAGQMIINPGRPTESVTVDNGAFSVVSAGVGSFILTAPEPTGTEQSAVLTVRDASGGVLRTQVVTVAAQQVALSLSETSPVAGSTVLVTAQLRSARGQTLNVAGRTVQFGVTDDGEFSGPSSAVTDASGSASVNLSTGPVAGTLGTATGTQDGVSGSASYTTVNGVANTTRSTVVLTPQTLKVNRSGSLQVTLQDRYGNPVTTVPNVTVDGGSTLGPVLQDGNIFTYPVTASASPETANFTVFSGGTVVGSINLVVEANPLVVNNGFITVANGSQYNFQDGNAHTFNVSESGYPGAFSVTSSNAAVATASVSGGTLTVTPGSTGGFSTIKVTDSYGQSVSFTVSVTTASLNIN